MCQLAIAQNHTAYLATSEGTPTTSIEAAAPTPAPTPAADPSLTSNSSSSSETLIMDYKSVYDSPTVDEEVKMATERFALTKSQQDVWLTAATERRETEKKAHDILESKDPSYSKESVYKGLRSAHNAFYETIMGYLTPHQKQALEADRLVLDEKRKRIAKLPPPPPPAPTITVAPVDSTAIKADEKAKQQQKKSKNKKKPTVGA